MPQATDALSTPLRAVLQGAINEYNSAQMKIVLVSTLPTRSAPACWLVRLRAFRTLSILRPLLNSTTKMAKAALEQPNWSPRFSSY